MLDARSSEDFRRCSKDLPVAVQDTGLVRHGQDSMLLESRLSTWKPFRGLKLRANCNSNPDVAGFRGEFSLGTSADCPVRHWDNLGVC